jgi:hypothetical protein
MVNIHDSINLNDWNSSELLNKTEVTYDGSMDKHGYWNIVAVYENGESEPLNGWMYVENFLISDIKNNGTIEKLSKNNLFLYYEQGLSSIKIVFTNRDNKLAHINLYKFNGKLLKCYNNLKSNFIILNPSKLNMASGNYIIQFTNKDTFYSQTFSFCR